MREEYDIVEDARVKKERFPFAQGFTKTLLVGLIFMIFCGLFFTTAYSYMRERIKKSEENSAKINGSSRKSYYIEQRLIQDLEKKSRND